MCRLSRTHSLSVIKGKHKVLGEPRLICKCLSRRPPPPLLPQAPHCVVGHPWPSANDKSTAYCHPCFNPAVRAIKDIGCGLKNRCSSYTHPSDRMSHLVGSIRLCKCKVELRVTGSLMRLDWVYLNFSTRSAECRRRCL